MSRIALIDYGAGNLHSVHNALRAVGADVIVTDDPAAVRAANRIVLPGVGSFKACAEGLRALPGMVNALEDQVIANRVPFLGICVGMQLLATRGLEHGEVAGLGWIAGEVRAIAPRDPSIKTPHMGWNDVAPKGRGDSHDVVQQGEAYFLHSYHFIVDDPANISAMTKHGEGLVAAVARDNIIGVQFHPEKSQQFGLALLKNFLDWTPR